MYEAIKTMYRVGVTGLCAGLIACAGADKSQIGTGATGTQKATEGKTTTIEPLPQLVLYPLPIERRIERIIDQISPDGKEFTCRDARAGLNMPPIVTTLATEVMEDGKPNGQYQFIATATDLDGKVVAYEWRFGDKETSTAQYPIHKFKTPGLYTAICEAIDDSGNRATNTVEVRVR